MHKLDMTIVNVWTMIGAVTIIVQNVMGADMTCSPLSQLLVEVLHPT